MGKCKPGWFTPKGERKGHRDSFGGQTAASKQYAISGQNFVADCGKRCPGLARYSATRPPDEECCKKCLRIDEAEKAQRAKKP